MTKPSKDLGVVYLSIKYIGDQRVICASNTREPNFEPYIPLQYYTALQVNLEMAAKSLEGVMKRYKHVWDYKGDIEFEPEYKMAKDFLTKLKKDQE